ncbi:hypothetical protein GDO78_003739 [Eleutherodactylus coqui]|uniref:Uncharacterized protein n=1 Tax=Eleutherodactylus coqui TaxID=57060 RepID=A0A8J6ETA0_ELECQ|nr:hypothetical protein GDO78_003739 [Eleutherodactylus coqui]
MGVKTEYQPLYSHETGSWSPAGQMSTAVLQCIPTVLSGNSGTKQVLLLYVPSDLISSSKVGKTHRRQLLLTHSTRDKLMLRPTLLVKHDDHTLI